VLKTREIVMDIKEFRELCAWISGRIDLPNYVFGSNSKSVALSPLARWSISVPLEWAKPTVEAILSSMSLSVSLVPHFSGSFRFLCYFRFFYFLGFRYYCLGSYFLGCSLFTHFSFCGCSFFPALTRSFLALFRFSF
jgi:hypothetical protein